MSPSIRPFTPADARPLLSTINAVCAEGRWMRTLRYEPTPAWEHALRDTDCPRHLLLVATDGPQVVGWCRLFPQGRADGQVATLGIGLLAPYRDQGLGTAMVRWATRWAADSNFKQVTLTTRADNQRAIHVFHNCGFVAAGHTADGSIEMSIRLAGRRPPGR